MFGISFAILLSSLTRGGVLVTTITCNLHNSVLHTSLVALLQVLLHLSLAGASRTYCQELTGWHWTPCSSLFNPSSRLPLFLNAWYIHGRLEVCDPTIWYYIPKHKTWASPTQDSQSFVDGGDSLPPLEISASPTAPSQWVLTPTQSLPKDINYQRSGRCIP